MPGLTEQQRLFEEAVQQLFRGEYAQSVETLGRLQNRGNHAAVNHNKALAHILLDQPDEAQEELERNMRAYARYVPSWILSAELHRRAGGRFLVQGSKLIRAALEVDRFDPQTCIVAAAIMNACQDCRQEAITWHINSLAAIKARGSKPSAQFVKVYVDDLLDQALHYWCMPPEEAVATGGHLAEAREQGRCLAVVVDGQTPTLPEEWRDWPLMVVTFGPGPRTTAAGHLHVRTEHRWAARFQAARAVLDVDVPTAVVWDSISDNALHPSLLDTQALVTRNQDLTAFCMKPASLEELHILRQLFHPHNIPPSTKPEDVECMVLDVFDYLAKDSQLDVECVHPA
ncbi:MAG: hypothetical protein EOO40_01495 [Deltaproteobacteria bacterium]|nr:MAG: hypothetical protein EOO40_01495 [Deltaproteobacteria bacterium]